MTLGDAEPHAIATNDGISKSGRFYPGVRIGERFYYGLRRSDRFFPGIVWCGRFVPGFVTKRGFFPALVTQRGLEPGIVALGVFIPGIVNHATFTPGILSDGRFIPGCFTTSRTFIPGRLVDGRFESGVVREDAFLPNARERITAGAARALSREGYGVARLARYSATGGVPVRGVVLGRFDQPAVLPHGIVTDLGVILGGVAGTEDLPVADPTAPLEDAGLHPNNPGTLLGIDDQYKKYEKLIEELGWLGFDPFGQGSWSSTSEPDLSINDALDALAQGEDKFIDGLNKKYHDYWDGVLGGATGGLIQEGSSSSNTKTAIKDIGTGALVGAGYGGWAGALVGAVAGFFYWLFVDRESDKPEDKQDKPPPSDKTSEPGEDGGSGSEASLKLGTGGPALAPYVANPRRTTTIAVRQDYDFGSAVPGAIGEKALVTIVQTDFGVVLVVNLRELAKAAGQSGRGNKFSIGMNPLNGQTTYVNPVAVDPNVRFGLMLVRNTCLVYLDPGHPVLEAPGATATPA